MGQRDPNRSTAAISASDSTGNATGSSRNEAIATGVSAEAEREKSGGSSAVAASDVRHALSVEHREEGVEAFRQERVREDRVRHGGVCELAQHGDLDHGHDLAALTTEDRAAQDLPAVRVDDGLHEAAGLAGLEGPDDVAHREFRHPNRASLCPGLTLGHAGAAKLRID